MPVNSQHKEYRKALKRWDLTRSVVDNDAKKFIRTVDASDIDRSNQYRDDAILTNFTALTKVGLTGLVFRKEGTLELPQELEYLKEDATGSSLSLDQLSQKVVGEVLETGRHGLLVDYPPTPEGLTKDQESEFSFGAHIKNYKAESIINWKTKTLGSKVALCLVVLEECVDDIGEDGFEWVEKTQYRVLQLSKENLYIQSIYNEDLELVSVSMPLKADGTSFNYIPFTFIGAENNDCCVDNIPLYDLAVINVGHYRNSADLEESAHLVGQPTITVATASSTEELKAANPAGLRFGSRQALVFGEGSSISLLQANPNQLASQMMLEKKDYAAALGARLIAPAGGRETAEAARIRFSSQNSALYTLTTNVGEGIEDCLEFCCDFMGADKAGVEYELNDQFYDDAADPALIMQQIQLFDRSLITQEEVRETLRMTSVIDPDSNDDGINAQAHLNNPLKGSNVI